MSLTKATRDDFWKAMAEHYGRRWYDDFGEHITQAWADLLDQYTPQDIKAAIATMHKRTEKQHPPTLPEFEVLLIAAVRSRRIGDTQQDYRRDFWRSAIVTAVSRGLGVHTDEFEPVLIEHRNTLGVALKELLDEVDGLEVKTGQRTDGILEHMRKRSAEIAKAYAWAPRRRALSA